MHFQPGVIFFSLIRRQPSSEMQPRSGGIEMVAWLVQTPKGGRRRPLLFGRMEKDDTYAPSSRLLIFFLSVMLRFTGHSANNCASRATYNTTNNSASYNRFCTCIGFLALLFFISAGTSC